MKTTYLSRRSFGWSANVEDGEASYRVTVRRGQRQARKVYGRTVYRWRATVQNNRHWSRPEIWTGVVYKSHSAQAIVRRALREVSR